jgi:hypothetical protein
VKLLGRFGPRRTSHSFFWQRGVGGDEAAAEILANKRLSNSRMTALIERVWAWIHDTFPERQIYIRSDGRVQFFTFGPLCRRPWRG